MVGSAVLNVVTGLTYRTRSPRVSRTLEHAAEILKLEVVAPLSQLQEVAKKAVEIHGKESMSWLLDSSGENT